MFSNIVPLVHADLVSILCCEGSCGRTWVSVDGQFSTRHFSPAWCSSTLSWKLTAWTRCRMPHAISRSGPVQVPVHHNPIRPLSLSFQLPLPFSFTPIYVACVTIPSHSRIVIQSSNMSFGSISWAKIAIVGIPFRRFRFPQDDEMGHSYPEPHQQPFLCNWGGIGDRWELLGLLIPSSEVPKPRYCLKQQKLDLKSWTNKNVIKDLKQSLSILSTNISLVACSKESRLKKMKVWRLLVVPLSFHHNAQLRIAQTNPRIKQLDLEWGQTQHQVKRGIATSQGWSEGQKGKRDKKVWMEWDSNPNFHQF